VTFTGAGWTPKHWATIPLPEWTPEQLPGYTEAKAAAERGESLTTPQPARIRKPRVLRSLDSLIAERDKCIAKRDALGMTTMPDDPGALSGIRRKPAGADHRSAARMDRELGQYITYSQRITYLNGRIARTD